MHYYVSKEIYFCTEPNPYCIIKCEAEKVTTHVCKATLTPEWNVGAIFYRRRPHSIPIKIQVRVDSS